MPRLPGVKLTDKGYYILMELFNQYPRVDQWVRPDSWWPGAAKGVVLPTCMKSIPRRVPPPAPAGLQRADGPTVMRWEADQMRYPPYQYKEDYLFWTNDCWRLCESSERELLHGFGFGHTEVCLSASDIKRGLQAYEDERCSLVGDSFNIFPFVVFGWAALFDYLPKFDYSHLCSRMGLAPGFAAPVLRTAPLMRRLQYGFPTGVACTIQDLSSCFLARTNHTGSDVRITTGAVLNPKAFPRQSVAASWFKWSGVFSCKWSHKDQINSLEMRAILLTLRWRALHCGESNLRFTHLTDSYICMSIISKGRSSSSALRHVLKKVSAWILAFNFQMVLVHVESTDNPTDEASRA